MEPIANMDTMHGHEHPMACWIWQKKKMKEPDLTQFVSMSMHKCSLHRWLSVVVLL